MTSITVEASEGIRQLAPVTNRRSTHTDKKTIQRQSKDPPRRPKGRVIIIVINKKKKRFV